MNGVSIRPPAASTFAIEVDWLFFGLLAFSGALGLFLVCLVITYAVRYRRGSSADRSGRISRTLPFEIGWTSAALLVAFGMFAWGAALFMQAQRTPADALRILAVGKQWMWKFQHPGGQREINALHIPLGRPIVVELASEDVIHSFFVPAFRIKKDAVPGRTNVTWFIATRAGTFHLFCAEFCGTAHSEMGGSVVAMPPEAYAAWLGRQPASISPVRQGEALFRALGCSGCHVGGTVRAPDLQQIYGRPVALSDGTTVIADGRYIRDSILMPKKQIAAGYDPVMPSFAGLIDETELLQLVAYIESLSSTSEP